MSVRADGLLCTGALNQSSMREKDTLMNSNLHFYCHTSEWKFASRAGDVQCVSFFFITINRT